MLASARLGDDLGLAEAAGEEKLAQGVVDLVGSRVVEILTLQPDVGAAGIFCQPLRLVQVTRAAHPGVERAVFLPEGGVVLDLVETLLEFRQAVHQRLGDVLPAKLAEALGDLAVHGGELGDQIIRVGDDGIHMGLAVGLLGGRDGLNDANLTGGLVLSSGIATAQVRAEVLDGLALLALGGLLKGADNHAANDDTVGKLGDRDEVVPRAHTEPNSRGLVSTVLLDPRQKLREVRVEGAESTSDALTRDDVDEGVGQLAEKAHAGVGGGRSDQGHIREPVSGVVVS